MVINICTLAFMLLWSIACEQSPQQDSDPEARRAEVVAQRFLSIVENNPQRGTALEKVFSHHLQLGTLDTFIGDLEKRANEDPSDGVAWMLLGLFESQRRMDTQAIHAFAEAEALRPDDPLPAFYRGQCLLRTGEPTQAVDAFEKAIARKPARIVLLEIFELLGRTHQRQNRSDLAIDAWKRLEANFPNDLRVLMQIATIQNQEGAYQDALPRYERLIPLTKDVFQRIQFRSEAAQLRIRLGESERGMLELQTVLGELRPDSWLYRDVQNKIEDVFLKSNDKPGLIRYYENRMEHIPDDIDSIIRLCKFLVSSNRVVDANLWIVKAINRAPSRSDLRRIYIEQLVADQQFATAIAEYEPLSKLDPKNSDMLRDWGKLVLRDSFRSAESANHEASRIWKKIIDNAPDDALTHVQVADLHQSVEMLNEAQWYFERAIELQPEEPQYREYLGDFLFRQNQRERAFEVWNSIAEGARRNAENIMRLAEIYEHAQQLDKASTLAAEACTLANQNSPMLVRAARLQKKAGQIDEALNSLNEAERLADNNDQLEFIGDERISILELSHRLKATTDLLQAQLSSEPNPSLEQMQLLARYLVRQRRWREANAVVLKALRSHESSLSLLRLSADIAEGIGDTNQAIQSLRKLAGSERRKRQEYLERIARLQIRQMKWVDAIETAKEVVQTIPSKIEGYEFLAQICFQCKNYALGIETLRKAMRIDPNSTRLTTQLATALIEHLDFNEAIELYWQAFAKSSTLDDKSDLVLKLSKAYEKQLAKVKLVGQDDKLSPLVDRLEIGRKDPAQHRDLTLCLAQVYQSANNLEKAKSTLEELLSMGTRDTNVLQQLAKLSLASGDLEMAINYQRQVVAVMPGQANESHLADLLRQRGDWIEANEIVVKLIQSEPDPSNAVRIMDGLLQKGEYELVLQTLDPMLRTEPNNWELLFRLGQAQSGIDQWAKARAAFELILSLDQDRKGFSVRRLLASKKRDQVNTAAQSPSVVILSPGQRLESDAELLKCTDRSELADIAMGRGRFVAQSSQGSLGPKWSPENFGEMRLACIAWLLHCESKDPNTKSEWIRQTLSRAKTNGSRANLIDAFAIVRLQQDIDALIPVAASLADSGEPAMQAVFLDAVRRRQVSGIALENKKRQPLTASQLDLLVESFTVVREVPVANIGNLTSPISMAIPNARMVNLQLSFMLSQMGSMPVADRMRFAQQMQQMLPGTRSLAMSRSSGTVDGLIRTVVNELQFAGRKDQADALISAQCASANTETQLYQLCEYLLSTQQFNRIEPPLLRWFDLQLIQLKETNAAAPSSTGVSSSGHSWSSPTAFAIRFLEGWGEEVALQSALRVLDSAMAASNQKYRNKNFPPIDVWSLAGNPRFAMQGNKSVQDWCIHFVSEHDQKLLKELQLAFIQANRSHDWLNYLNSRVASVDGPLRALEKIRLALSIEQGALQEGAQNTALDALLSISEDPGCELYAAAAFLAKRDFKMSMKVASNLSPTNPQDSLIRALILLHASSSLSDQALMERSLLELKSHSLDSVTLQSINGPLQKATYMGLTSAMEWTPNRPTARTNINTARVAPKSTPSQESLRTQAMMEYSKSGNHSEAIKIARQLVSKPRTLPPISPKRIVRNTNPQGISSFTSAPSSSNPSGSSDAFRRAGLERLKHFGELEKLISETEQRITTAPDAFPLLDQLAEFQETAGNSDQAIDAMTRALQLRPNASPLRLYLARFLSQTIRNKDKACDQFIELIRRDPNAGLLQLDHLPGLFETCNRTADLLKAIRSSNFQSLQNRNEILVYTQSLFAAPPTFEVAAVILQKLVDTDPALRQNALQIMYGAENRPYPRFMEFVADSLIPTEFESTNDPWFGLQDFCFHPKTAEQTTLFESILSCHNKEDLLEKLAPTIRAALERMPVWYAGQVMLALIEVSSTQSDAANDRFAELAAMKRLHVGCPGPVAWRLAKEFEARSQPGAAIRMLETLVGSNSFFTLSPEKLPVMMLVRLRIANGERNKAIEAINKEFETGQLALQNVGNARTGVLYSSGSISSVGSASVGNYAVTQKPNELANCLLSLGLPVEAYRQFGIQNGLDQFNSQRATVFPPKAETGKQEAVALLQKLPADHAIAELLYDRTLSAQNLPALELMLKVPFAKDAASQQIESELQSTLIRYAKAGKLPAITQRLGLLSTIRPDDISILATIARIRLATGEGDAQAALHEVDRVLPTTNQHNLINLINEAETGFSLWLVARECYQVGKYLEIADRLAERASKAANALDNSTMIGQRTTGPSPSMQGGSRRVDGRISTDRTDILLLEWGSALIRNGSTKQGTEKWQELLMKLENSNPMHNGFNLHVSLAERAAEAGVLNLAMKIATKLAGLQSAPGESAIPLPLVHKILDRCDSDAQRYDFLLALVFAPQDVILNAKNVDLLRNPPNNLGDRLVLYATQLNRLDDLKIKIEERKSSLNRDILRAQVAIAERDFAAAKELLEKLFAEYLKLSSSDNLDAVCQVAIPAFRIQELREAAFPILRKLLQREKGSNKSTDAELDQFPLVIEIDDYLRSHLIPKR